MIKVKTIVQWIVWIIVAVYGALALAFLTIALSAGGSIESNVLGIALFLYGMIAVFLLLYPLWRLGRSLIRPQEA